MLTKHDNKKHGYRCDKTKMVPKVIYSDENGFYCEEVAKAKFGEEEVLNAESE